MSKLFNEAYEKLGALYEEAANSAQVIQNIKHNAAVALSLVAKFKNMLLPKIMLLKGTYGNSLKTYADTYNKWATKDLGKVAVYYMKIAKVLQQKDQEAGAQVLALIEPIYKAINNNNFLDFNAINWNNPNSAYLSLYQEAQNKCKKFEQNIQLICDSAQKSLQK